MVSELIDEMSPQEQNKNVKELKYKISHLEELNGIIQRRNEVLTKEIKELKIDVEARDACLEAFKIRNRQPKRYLSKLKREKT